MRVVVAIAIGITVWGVASRIEAQQPAEADRTAALHLFHERIETYITLHRRLEAPLPPMTVSTDTWSMLLARRYLASEIRAARSTARQGDIFSPDVAMMFRQLIGEALEGRDVEALVTEWNEEHPLTHGVHPVVNEPYPGGASHMVQAILLQHLPPLREDVEYRILDHDLVLWDIHADLVVDFVPFAFGAGPTTRN